MPCIPCEKRKEWLRKQRDEGLEKLRAAKKLLRDQVVIRIFKRDT